MECATVSTGYDDGAATTLSEKIVTARKQHKCHECQRKIQPGERYENYVGLYVNVFRHKTCLDCVSLRDVFFTYGYTYEAIWQDMWEHIYECGDEISESALSRLTPAARARVCDMISEIWWDEEEDEE